MLITTFILYKTNRGEHDECIGEQSSMTLDACKHAGTCVIMCATGVLLLAKEYIKLQFYV